MKISTITDQNKREYNQDNKFVIPKVVNGDKVLLAVVADGMGGTDEGGEASRRVKVILERWFEDNIKDLHSQTKMKNSLNKALKDINDEIYSYGKENLCSLGTTAAIIILKDKEYIVANIGDSRVYKFSSKPIQITKDQTLAQREIDAGNMTVEEAKLDKKSHTLTQCLGMSDDVEPDFFRGKYKDGDYFLLCSDGLYNRIEIEDIEEVIKQKKKNTKEKLTELVIMSKETGETDNITGILIEI